MTKIGAQFIRERFDFRAHKITRHMPGGLFFSILLCVLIYFKEEELIEY